jgi:hypothetical protein
MLESHLEFVHSDTTQDETEQNRRVETTRKKIQTLMEDLLEDLQSDLKAERQKTEQLQNALQKLDVEFDYIITHGQMMYPNNEWIIDTLRKMKRRLQQSINISNSIK